MGKNKTSEIRSWPPSINWTLLDESDPTGPRQFLKQESWKLLLAPKHVLEEDHFGRSKFTIPVHIPDNLKGIAEGWLDPLLRSAIRLSLQEHAPSIDPSSTKLQFKVVRRKHLETQRQEALKRLFRDRTLQDWLRLFIKGRFFANEIGSAEQDRYVFIEEVYCRTKSYDDVRNAYLDNYRQPILIKGVPRAGKTYAALRLLYEVLENPKASIKLVSTFSDPTELTQVARTLKDRGGQLFAVFDDPFGVEDYNDSHAAPAVEAIRTIAENYSQHRLLITTRDEVFRAARNHRPEMRSLQCTEIKFEPEGTEIGATRYSDILERTAWLHGANWLPQFRRYLKNEAPEGVSAELREAWQTVLQQSYVPGVLLSAFILYPKIANLDVRDPAQVRKIGFLVKNAVDVWSAFRSELNILLREAKSGDLRETKSDDAVLYLLLPSLTLVQEETLAAVFTNEEREAFRRAGLDQYFEARVGDDFAVKSYRYKLDVFAEVAQDVLKKEGLIFLEKSILPELARRISLGRTLPGELLADVLTRYFWLGGQIGNHCVTTLRKELQLQSTASAQWDQINVLGFLFQSEEPKLGYDLLVEKLTKADPLLVSNVASILDQLLTTQIGERTKLVERVARVVGELYDEYFASPQAEESPLRASLLLHGVLSHLENYFVATGGASLISLKETGGVDVVLRNLLGVAPLFRRIEPEKRDWAGPALMWLDAIIMKLGELNLYLLEHKPEEESCPIVVEEASLNGLETPFFSLPDAVVRQNRASDVLQGRLAKELDSVMARIRKVANNKQVEFIKGGLLFTLVWHNRWCSAESSTNEISEIANWARDCAVLTGSSDQTESWEGIYFNIAYHARYFEAKISAWQRESAIYRLHHEKGPRLGADTLHESGLWANRQLNDWRPMFEMFYSNCLNRLLPDDSSVPVHTGTSPPHLAEQASFLLGMRSHREPSLQKEYIARIHYAFENETCPWQQDLWRAVTKLFAFNLVEAMEVVKEAIRTCGSEAKRRGRGPLFDVIDEVTREFDRSGARYVAANLDWLKNQF